MTESAFDRQPVPGTHHRKPDFGIRSEELPPRYDPRTLANVESTVARRSTLTRGLIDDRVSVLDAMHGRDRVEDMETTERLDAVPDDHIEQKVNFPLSQVPESLVRGNFHAIARRAYAILDRAQVVRKAGRFKGPRYTRDAMELMAQVVAGYHVSRHTPRSERCVPWPQNAADYCVTLGINGADLREAIYQTQLHKWEARYLPKIDSAARVSIIKDVLQTAVERQLSADPGKENANLFRTALQAEGAIQGTQKVTQVNVNSNVLNLPEGMTQESLQARLEAVSRLAQRFKPNPKEVPVGEQDRAREVLEGPGGEPGAAGEDSPRLPEPERPTAG